MSTKFDKRTGLEVLDRVECLALVRRSVIGRLAVSVDNRPLVFPVNFALDGNTVVIRTNEGTKLWAARHSPVAFECDGFDPVYHTGWSVMLSGCAEEIHNPTDRRRAAALPLTPWCTGDRSVWLRIRPGTVTGRRIPPHGEEQCTP
jgi:nitroimidazol reductase NimA-like FMN-containing flavoprotein (pyridoxamine 5'-phosphate oxidase superfamily)